MAKIQSIPYPQYTTAQRDALSVDAGYIINNTTDSVLQIFNGADWDNYLAKIKNKPFLNSGQIYKSNQSVNVDISIYGSFFEESMIISISGQTINSITFISDNEISVNIDTGTTDGFYDIDIINSAGKTTMTGVFEIKLSVWIDLRAGGDVLTDGNGAGNDIRYRSGMSLTRDANGMSFSGSNPWSSWVKFEIASFLRSSNQTVRLIMTQPTGAMMIGIGSDATNETSTSQYSQMETEAYFQSSTTLYGLYGNNGTIGSAGDQSNSATISNNTYKIEFTNSGTAGISIFTLYQLPSSNPADWDDESNIVTSFLVGGSLNPDEENIMPSIIPPFGGTQRFLALKVE